MFGFMECGVFGGSSIRNMWNIISDNGNSLYISQLVKQFEL